MKNPELQMAIRNVGFYRAALLLCASVLAADPAIADPDVDVERSITVSATSTSLWSRFGSFCAVADWDPAFGSCHFLKGQGDVGTVRRIERRTGGAPIVEELMATSGSSYSYRAIDGSSEGTLTMRPGPHEGTTLVTWRIAAEPAASAAFREALRLRVGPAVQVALETLAHMAGGATPSGGD